MAVFSTNQVRQFYVVNKHIADIMTATEVGTIAVKHDNAKNHMYFQYKGADNIMRSDLIPLKNIQSVSAVSASKFNRNLKAKIVQLNANVNAGIPVAGQDYVLRISFRQFIGMSDSDMYFKHGMVHAYAGMTPDMFYKVLANSLALNFSRELEPLVKIEVHSKATKSKGGFDAQGYKVVTPALKDNGAVDAKNPYWDGTAVVKDIDSIRITEVEQPWRRGLLEQVPVYFEVNCDSITVEGDEMIWGVVTDAVNGQIHNGKTVADMEYFYMGERGDMYRSINWPNNIETTYLVDANKPYHVIDIHYFYEGSNEAVQHSEKTITLVSNSATELNKVIQAINTATGLTLSNVV